MGILHIVVLWEKIPHSLVGDLEIVSTKMLISIYEITQHFNSDHNVINFYCLLALFRMCSIIFKMRNTLKLPSKICNNMFP
jgi:hypothetical protein